MFEEPFLIREKKVLKIQINTGSKSLIMFCVCVLILQARTQDIMDYGCLFYLLDNNINWIKIKLLIQSILKLGLSRGWVRFVRYNV